MKQRARAIIISGENIITMYREFDDKSFYTFPGGGVEDNETLEECVVREVYEEFGIKVKPIKKLYDYEGMGSLEHFYLCKWICGEINDLKDLSHESTGGLYVPTMMKISDIPNFPLVPQEIAENFYNDYVSKKLINI